MALYSHGPIQLWPYILMALWRSEDDEGGRLRVEKEEAEAFDGKKAGRHQEPQDKRRTAQAKLT